MQSYFSIPCAQREHTLQWAFCFPCSHFFRMQIPTGTGFGGGTGTGSAEDEAAMAGQRAYLGNCFIPAHILERVSGPHRSRPEHGRNKIHKNASILPMQNACQHVSLIYTSTKLNMAIPIDTLRIQHQAAMAGYSLLFSTTESIELHERSRG